MRQNNRKQPPYKAVPVEEQEFDAPPSGDPEPQNDATVQHSVVKIYAQDGPLPQPLNISWLERILRLIFDLIIAVIALLFAVFGVWVVRADGDPAGPGSTGARLFNASQYVCISDSLLPLSPRTFGRLLKADIHFRHLQFFPSCSLPSLAVA